MKKILTSLAFALLIHSCCLLPVERTGTNEYVLINNTNHFITIYYVFEENVYDPEIIRDTIEIEPNSEFLEYKLFGFHGESPGIFPVTTDSVIINFDYEKKTIQACEHFSSDACTIERNIVGYWNEANYTKKVIGRECGDKEYRYTYTFTEEDYNNAVPIED